jgi:hypothetical protein
MTFPADFFSCLLSAIQNLSANGVFVKDGAITFTLIFEHIQQLKLKTFNRNSCT